jgi:hypothetical protein
LGTGNVCPEANKQQQRKSTEAPPTPKPHAGNAAQPFELNFFHDGFPLLLVESFHANFFAICSSRISLAIRATMTLWGQCRGVNGG